jgi:hypothetical protein
MNVQDASQEASRRLKIHGLLSVATFVVGVVLLVYMIVVEDEPGALPLLLVAIGIGWFVVTRLRIRSQHK